jgi:hypothetical protein
VLKTICSKMQSTLLTMSMKMPKTCWDTIDGINHYPLHLVDLVFDSTTASLRSTSINYVPSNCSVPQLGYKQDNQEIGSCSLTGQDFVIFLQIIQIQLPIQKVPSVLPVGEKQPEHHLPSRLWTQWDSPRLPYILRGQVYYWPLKPIKQKCYVPYARKPDINTDWVKTESQLNTDLKV